MIENHAAHTLNEIFIPSYLDFESIFFQISIL
jgi:hypothetical protein